MTHVTDGVTGDIIWLQLTGMSLFNNMLGLLRKEKKYILYMFYIFISYTYSIYLICILYILYIAYISKVKSVCYINRTSFTTYIG